MDNLRAHKSSEIWDVMKDKQALILYTPVYSPQFSPIEVMFGKVKKQLKDFIFRNKEETCLKIQELMFGLDRLTLQKFYRKTLNNMVEFWKEKFM